VEWSLYFRGMARAFVLRDWKRPGAEAPFFYAPWSWGYSPTLIPAEGQRQKQKLRQRQGQKQIPFGDDNQKGKDNGNSKDNGKATATAT
jgi:hypothetical protein